MREDAQSSNTQSSISSDFTKLILVGGAILLPLIIPLIWWYYMYAQVVLTTAFLLGGGVLSTLALRQMVHNVRMVVQSIIGTRENFERLSKLQISNARERERLAFDRLMQPLVIDALSKGKNFTYTSKGDITISDWKSNVHTMTQGTVEGGLTTLQLESPRPTIEEVSYNSFLMSPGLTQEGEHVVVQFKGTHLKFVGTSQMGKSSLICYLLKSIMQTHSPNHVQVAILDLEGLNSNLLKRQAHVRYVAQMELKPIVQGVQWAVDEMNRRYTLGAKGMGQEPLLILYIEEYLDLVNQLKLYDNELFKAFVTNMTTLATRALKANICLWLAMQTNYSDDMLKEALANIPYGHCLGLHPNAGRAAGFPDNDLLKENFKRAQPGTSYARYPSFKGLINHHTFDIKSELTSIEEEMEELS